MADPQVSIWIRAKDAATSAFKSAERGIRSFGRVALSVGRDLGAIAAGTAAAVAGLTKLAQRGADVLGVQKAFNRVVGGDGAAALEQLRTATGGVVNDFDLMSKFNISVARGMVRSVEEFGALSKAATTLSDVIGVDDTQAFEMLADALGKGNAKGLANLGIMIDQKAAADAYAKSIGKQAKDLTDLEKKEANRQAGMKEAVRLAEELSGGELGAADAANRFAAQVANLKDQIALLVATSPNVAKFFDAMRDGLDMLAGKDAPTEALRKSIGNMTDPRALDARKRALEGEKAQLLAQQFQTSSRFLRPGHLGEDKIKKDFELKKIRDELIAIDQEAQLVAQRIKEIAAGPMKVGAGAGPGSEGGGTGTGRAAAPGPFDATKENLDALLDKLAEAKIAVRDARLDQAIAPSDAALKKLHEAEETLGRLTLMLGQTGKIGFAGLMSEKIGGLGENQLASVADINDIRELPGTVGPFDAERRALKTQELTGGWKTGPGGVRFQDPEKIVRLTEDVEKDVEKASNSFADAGALAISSFGAMAQAAIEGSRITASSVIGMMTNIAQSLPGVGQLGGAVIGAVGGLIGGLFGRRERTPVHIESVSDAAARAIAGQEVERTYHFTIVNQGGQGQEVGRTEYELKRRERRDAVPRYVVGT